MQILSLLNLDDLKDKYMIGSIIKLENFHQVFQAGKLRELKIARALQTV